MKKKTKQPWPTKDVMNQIYDQHLWGGKDVDFYSGVGSHDSKIITPYLEALTSFLKSYNNDLTICDLGCGDFNVGKHLVQFAKKYIAFDIVDQLIERNKTIFKENHLEFRCLDIATDKLPITDVIILRQVLQHLSNSEIINIVKKITNYKFLILTEHIPTGQFIANKDIISGQGIRLKYNSGVDLLEPPFNLKIVEQSLLNKVVLNENEGQIVTTLYRF